MKLAKQLGIATAGIALSFATMNAKPAEAAFVGAYDVSKWSLVNETADGFVNTDGAPAQIQLYGGNNANRDQEGGTTDYLVKAVADGVVSFKWNYSTDDDFAIYDGFSFVKNDTLTDLFVDFETTGQDTYTTTLAAGDVFGFRISTLDNLGGRGNVIISDFNAAVPEPFTVGGSVVALGFGLWMKRKQAASQKV